jgi:adenylate cyclase
MGDAVDFAAEGLLDGLEGEARAERLRLLEYLHGDGVPLATLREAVATGTHVFLPAERFVGGEPKYTARELAARSGLELEFMMRLRRANGFPIPEPDAVVFCDADLAEFRTTRQFRDAGLPEEDMLEIGRVLGHGMARAAAAMRAVVLKLALRPGASEHELAVDYTQVVSRLMPLVEPLVGAMMNAHLRHMAQTEAVSLTELASGQLPGARDIAVGFADLVGFTRMGEEVPADELGRVAERLATLAADTVSPPVRLVKTIGDAAMLVSHEPDAMIEAAFGLVGAADAEGAEFPQLRVGLAWGSALSRAGDWFGRPVNLADRVTAVAKPGSVLVTRELRDAVAHERYRWSFAGARRLKGVRDPVALFRARPIPNTDV